MSALNFEPGSAAPAPHIGYQIDHSFGPPMLYVEGDRRDRPPLLTINIAHEHELLITDQQARALQVALDELLSPPRETTFIAPRPSSLHDMGDRQCSAVQTSADARMVEQHSIENEIPRLTATADDLQGSVIAPHFYGSSRQWLCATRWIEDRCWRAVGPTGGWLVFSSMARFLSWRDAAGATWNVWGHP